MPYCIQLNGTRIESDPWRVYQVRVLPDIKHRTEGTRVGHARCQNVEDEDDIWDVPFRNLDISRAEAESRCLLSN